MKKNNIENKTRHLEAQPKDLKKYLPRFFANAQNDVKRGFTLAEVLITLGIIGVVAALTIPTLVANYQAKSWNTAADVFEKRLTEAIKTMNVQGKLGSYGGYSTTEGFVQELQKHFKIAKVCDKDHLMECFEDKITMNDEEVDMTGVTKAKHFGQKDWGTNIVGLQIANGTSALIAYNPKCKANPYDNDITGSDCYAIVYDTSGYSNPNELSKDLRKSASVLNIKGQNCAFEVGGTCFGTPFYPKHTTKAECEEQKDKLGIKVCSLNYDSWAGAVSQCDGVDKLATPEDLTLITEKLYGIKAEVYGVVRTDMDVDLATSLGFPKPPFNMWSNLETSGSVAADRWFYPGYSGWNNKYGRNSEFWAICVEH